MACKNCNYYSHQKRICVKTGKFEFEDMPICSEYLEEEQNLESCCNSMGTLD